MIRRFILIILLLHIVLVAAALFIGASLPDGGQVAFQSNRDGGDADILSIDLRTRLLVNLTDHSRGDEASPAWSPDGAYLAYEYSEFAARTASQIYIMTAAGDDARPISPRDGSTPIWSPDGLQIAFYSNAYLTLANPFGVGEAPISRDALPEWTIDGLRFLLARGQVVPAESLVSTSNPATVTATLAGSIVDPYRAPGGRYIAFVLWDGVTTSVFRLDTACLPDCKDSAQLVPGTQNGRDPAISPDGSRLAYICRDVGRDELCIVNADGSGLQQVTTSPRGIYQRSPTWRP
jgi:Tol biopolymer transport system component